MPKNDTLTTRVTRLEHAMGEMTEKANILFDAQIKTEQRFQQLREEGAEREKRMDERIEKLVSAIGELISRMPPQTLR